MSRKYQQRNSRTIEKSFQRLRANADKAFSAGMYAWLMDALDYLVGIHDPGMHHPNEEDTLGCAIVHNGEIVKIWGQARGAAVADNKATDMLRQMVPSVPKQGCVGIVLSGMRGWYNVSYEEDFLNQTAGWTAESFTKYFKPI